MYFSNDQSLKFQEKKDKPVGKRAHSEKNTIYLPFKKINDYNPFQRGEKIGFFQENNDTLLKEATQLKNTRFLSPLKINDYTPFQRGR